MSLPKFYIILDGTATKYVLYLIPNVRKYLKLRYPFADVKIHTTLKL